MQRSAADLRPDGARARIALTAERAPEWRPWLDLVALTVAELEAGAWAATRLRRTQSPGPGQPLLDGAEITVDASVAGSWLDRLSDQLVRTTRTAPALPSGDRERMLELALRQQDGTPSEHAADSATLRAGAALQLAAMPALHACRERYADHLPAAWLHGYCPLCAGWPILAELRGLDRTRNLRCARCGGDWTFPVLRCPFCGEDRHQALAALVVENGDGRARVDTCRTCRGYVKTLTTLRALAPGTLLLDDLETIALDLVARERGFGRPPGRERGVDVRLQFATSAGAPPAARL